MRDLPSVVPMAVEEFGTGGPPLSIDEVPWEKVTADNIQQYTDRILFGPLVSLALEMKILRQQKTGLRPDYTILCLQEDGTDGEIIGMVELSWQPPEAERNPPPVPLPFWAKLIWSRIRGLPNPDGWITNLLVSERHRGQGYSKVLMSAAEGLARSWGCTAIYLHVDADTVSGRVAQSLYRNLGYEPVMDDRALQKYSWMGPELASMGLFVVDGVPLLFLKKTLNETL
jgi:GNAT superfamily N-acetyltransferase